MDSSEKEFRVPTSEKIALGAGSLPAFLGYAGVSTLAFPVYQMTYGVNAFLLGIALMVPRIWDAFADPLMGQNTRITFIPGGEEGGP